MNKLNKVTSVSILFSVIFLIAFNCAYSLENELIERIKYETIIENINKKHVEIKNRYLNTEDTAEQKSIIHEARDYVFNILTQQIFPAWYGTPWSFNGQTKIPHRGSIACGYFVIHTLQDAGFDIPSKMAKQTSENIIKNLIDPSGIKRFWNAADMKDVTKWIKAKGEGLYIVGLDIHVGFVINQNNKITFCHSSYYNPPLKVVNQNLQEESPLTDSKYRVFGKILDDIMIEKWISGKSFPVVYDYFKTKAEH